MSGSHTADIEINRDNAPEIEITAPKVTEPNYTENEDKVPSLDEKSLAATPSDVSVASTNGSTEIVNKEFQKNPTGSLSHISIEEITSDNNEVPQSLYDLIGDNLIRNNGHESNVKYDNALEKTQVIGLYFADHLNISCRGFTPILKNAYQQWTKQKYAVEIIFISQGKDEREFEDDLRESHGEWLALKFNADEEIQEELKHVFDVISIPSLIFINKHNDVINANGIIPVSQNGWRAAEQLLEQFVALEITKNERMLSSDHESEGELVRPSIQLKAMGQSMGKMGKSVKQGVGKGVRKSMKKMKEMTEVKKSKGIFACCLSCPCCDRGRARKKRSKSGKGSYQMTRNLSNSRSGNLRSAAFHLSDSYSGSTIHTDSDPELMLKMNPTERDMNDVKDNTLSVKPVYHIGSEVVSADEDDDGHETDRLIGDLP